MIRKEKHCTFKKHDIKLIYMNFKDKHILILDWYSRQCLPYLREFKKIGM